MGPPVAGVLAGAGPFVGAPACSAAMATVRIFPDTACYLLPIDGTKTRRTRRMNERMNRLDESSQTYFQFILSGRVTTSRCFFTHSFFHSFRGTHVEAERHGRERHSAGLAAPDDVQAAGDERRLSDGDRRVWSALVVGLQVLEKRLVERTNRRPTAEIVCCFRSFICCGASERTYL